MRNFTFFAAVAVLAITGWLAYITYFPAPHSEAPKVVQKNSGSNQQAQEHVHSAKPSEIPRAKQQCGKNACSHEHHPEAKVNILIADKNQKTWPSVVLLHLEKTYRVSKKSTKHLSRAISYAEFERLDEAKLERLVRYSEYALSQHTTALPHLCWAVDTPTPVRTAFDKVRFLALEEGNNGDPQPVFQGDDRWTFTATDGSTGSQGTPVTLTWSFVPDGTTLDGDATGTSNLIATLNSTYGASATSSYEDAPWFELFETAFAYWSEVTGNIYVYEPNDDGKEMNSSNSSGSLGVRGDVRIGGGNIDGNSGTLAYNYYPNSGDMVIDTADSSNFTNNNNTKARFRNVIAHEHGHGLGLDHVCPINQTKLMEPFVTTSFTGVQFDDILTVQGIYGDSRERSTSAKNNDSIGTAHDFGNLNGNTVAKSLSISNTGDVDIYKFSISNGKRLNLKLTPTTEAVYLEGVQNSNGCSSGTNFNPNTRQNLSVRILAADGTTVIAQANSAAIGAEETIDDLLLSQTGTNYFIEVTGGGENNSANNNAQAYSLSLEFENASSMAGSNFTLIQEGCAPANQAIDPGETVTAQITVTNSGLSTIPSPSVTISGSANFISLDTSTKNLPSLSVGQSATVTFQFKINGSCGSQEVLSFLLDTGSGSTSFTQAVTLGNESLVIDENFESSSSLPPSLTADGGGATSAWVVSNTSPINGSRSAFSAGSNSQTAHLVTSELIASGTNPTLSFSHYYDFENTFDGGTLEIKIENGPWQEWTVAGGTITANSYNGTVSSNPAWTGDSDESVVTTASLPATAIGKTIRIRWRASYDFSVLSEGWGIDDISLNSISCCEGNVPTVSIITSDSSAQENNVSNTGEFTITSSSAPSSDLDINYTITGTATSGVDFQALSGTATFTSGQQMVTIPVTAIKDSEVEGNETVTVTISLSSEYAVDTGVASLTIEDLPFDDWRKTFFGSSTVNIGDTDDFDFDGLDNLIEYALGKDPTLITPNMPSATLVNGGTQLSLSFQEDTNLTDIQYIVEVSPTLGAGVSPWTTTGVTLSNGPLNDGKRTVTATANVSGERQFMRLRVIRN